MDRPSFAGLSDRDCKVIFGEQNREQARLSELAELLQSLRDPFPGAPGDELYTMARPMTIVVTH